VIINVITGINDRQSWRNFDSLKQELLHKSPNIELSQYHISALKINRVNKKINPDCSRVITASKTRICNRVTNVPSQRKHKIVLFQKVEIWIWTFSVARSAHASNNK
jgi:hypothetical protein